MTIIRCLDMIKLLQLSRFFLIIKINTSDFKIKLSDFKIKIKSRFSF